MYKRFFGGKISRSYSSKIKTKSKIQTKSKRNIFTKGKMKTRSKSKQKDFPPKYIDQLIQRYIDIDEEISPKK